MFLSKCILAKASHREAISWFQSGNSFWSYVSLLILWLAVGRESWPHAKKVDCVYVCACVCQRVCLWESVCAWRREQKQYKVDGQCFWLDSRFALLFTFNPWCDWLGKGSQNGTAGFNSDDSMRCGNPMNNCVTHWQTQGRQSQETGIRKAWWKQQK